MIYTVNGYEIKPGKGKTGYYGSSVSLAWTLDPEKPFIAAVANPIDDPVLSKWLTAKKRKALHMGYYADSREAAYVSAVYEQHPEDVLIELYNNKKLSIEFPKKLYTLPQHITREEVILYQQKNTLSRKRGTKQRKGIRIEDALRVAREVTNGRKLTNVAEVRAAIETRVNSGLYFDENDVRDHIKKIVTYA